MNNSERLQKEITANEEKKMQIDSIISEKKRNILEDYKLNLRNCI